MTHPAPKVTQTNRAFSMVCGVEVNVLANAAIIWRLLTDAAGFPLELDGQRRRGANPRRRAPFERYANDLKREAQQAAR